MQGLPVRKYRRAGTLHAPSYEEGHIVLQFVGRGPLPHAVHDDLYDSVLFVVGVVLQQRDKTVLTEHFAVGVFGFRDAVGVADEKVAGLFILNPDAP